MVVSGTKSQVTCALSPLFEIHYNEIHYNNTIRNTSIYGDHAGKTEARLKLLLVFNGSRHYDCLIMGAHTEEWRLFMLLAFPHWSPCCCLPVCLYVTASEITSP